MLAIILEEPESEAFRQLLQDNPAVMSPVNYWEVLTRAYMIAREAGANRAMNIIQALGVEIAEPERRSPEYFAKFVAEEIARWSGPIKASGVSAD